jgi:dTDP-4-amino-4,6-dideoxygalactose transaminase
MPGQLDEDTKFMETIESGIINRVQSQALRHAIDKGASDPLYLTSISGTGPVEEFEVAFAKAVGGRHALALSSCTAAIHTALMALGIGPGNEVIVTPYSWGQSVAPVLFAGATAVFADIDPVTLTMDPESVESRLSASTRAIIPVHIFGNPANMNDLCAIAKRHGLAVISDSAQGFGALTEGRKIASLGDAACFSLGRGKAVCGGEGGVLVTSNKTLYERAVCISQHPLRAFRQVSSQTDLPFLDELNWNYRIHPFAAILALADLKVTGERVNHRQTILKTVCEQFEAISSFDTIRCYPGDCSAAYGVSLTYDFSEQMSRQSAVERLQSNGFPIQAGPIRVPIHLRQTFQHTDFVCGPQVAHHYTHKKGSCPVAEKRCEHQELLLFEASILDKLDINKVKNVIWDLKHRLSEL